MNKIHDGVCEINTHLDGAGVFNVPTSLHSFQSWRKDAQEQLTKLIVCLFHRPIALTLRMSVNIYIRGDGASPTLTTSRMSDYFTDTGRT